MEMDGRDDAVKRRPCLLHGHEKEDLFERPNPTDTGSFIQVLCCSFEDVELEEVFVTSSCCGSRVNRQLQKAPNSPGTAADEETNQENECNF